MRDFLGANGSPPLCVLAQVVAFFPPSATRAGVLEPLQKWVGHVLSITNTSSLTFCNPGAPPIFFNGPNTSALTRGRIMNMLIS